MLSNVNAVAAPPLITSGALSPLNSHAYATSTPSATAVSNANLTNSYADVAAAAPHQSDARAFVAPDAVVHDDLTRYEIGAFTIIRSGAVLRPPIRVYVQQSAAAADAHVKIGAFVYIGAQVVCEAAEVGPLVRIETQCVLSAGVRVPEGVWLLEKSWVPPDAPLAPYTVYRGVPATPVRKLNAAAHQVLHLEFLREIRSAAGKE